MLLMTKFVVFLIGFDYDEEEKKTQQQQQR